MKPIQLKSLLNEREEEDYTSQTVKAANDKLKEFGIREKVDPKKHFGTGFNVIASGNVDLSKLPALPAVFESMEYKVTAGGSPNGRIFRIIFQADWKHPDGSNGYKVSYSYEADKKRWTP